MALRRFLPVLAALAAALVMTPAPATAAPNVQAAGANVRFVDIAGAGVTLKANVTSPSTAGRHPAIIFPSSWGLNDLEYIAQARKLAADGYVVVSYTPRGWWSSGGEIDTAGPKDMADLSRVVDWTMANTATDPSRIGAAGVSYGAGISLLGSAVDSRIRAVAMMSGWTDLVYSLYGDQTRHRQSADLLALAADLLGNPGPDLSGKLADFRADRNVEQVQAWARERSPRTYLDAINANGPAVLIANAWGDSFFPPNQLIDLYGRLTVPKRLELRPGDHAIAELGGILGLPNEVWESAHDWFDEHLRLVGTRTQSVRIKPENSAAETYGAWDDISTVNRRYGLGKIRALDQTGLLGGTPTSGWTKTLPTDRDTTAGGGIVLITNGAAAFTGHRPSIWLPTVDRSRAAVWAGDRPSAPQRIRGVPHVHLHLESTEATGTIVAYLYDLDLLGTAKLITHAPVSWLNATPGSRTVDVDLSATAYDVPAGHALTLVVDTTDPLYYDANAPGDTVTIGGGSYVDVPLR
jgi:hypothetical protein